METNNCIYTATAEVILSEHGTTALHNFNNILSSAGIHVGVTTGYPDAVQITLINKFWMDILNSVPNSTSIKSWLVTNNDTYSYINDFKQHWLRLLVNLGVL